MGGLKWVLICICTYLIITHLWQENKEKAFDTVKECQMFWLISFCPKLFDRPLVVVNFDQHHPLEYRPMETGYNRYNKAILFYSVHMKDTSSQC